MKILKKEIKKQIDECPDLDYLGVFSDIFQDGAINHCNNSRQYKYFIPANPEYGKQDYKRMLKYISGEICDYGISAEAEVEVCGVVQRIRSGGLWGIASDCDEEEMMEVEKEQMAELDEILEKLGAKNENIAK